MRNTRLILVTGMSGAGKSTTSKGLARQLSLNGVRCRWLHEECRRHPIRDGEFNIGSLYDPADMERNIQDMYRRWQRMVSRIQRSKSVYIVEGTLYDNIFRYFFVANYPAEQIAVYFDHLMEIMTPLNPTVVFLYRSDVRATLEGLYGLRGTWWKNLILDPKGYRYCEDRGLTGEAGAYQMWQAYQDLSDVMFERVQGCKIRVDTFGGQWDSHLQRLAEYFGLAYHPRPALVVENPEQYAGKYETFIGEQPHSIQICPEPGGIYCQSFWPYMKLLPLGGARFEFASFPIRLTFQKDSAGQVRAVRVSGDYDWEIMGATMQRSPAGA